MIEASWALYPYTQLHLETSQYNDVTKGNEDNGYDEGT